MDSKVLPFPFCRPEDIPGRLRELADRIEAGEFGEIHSIAWVADCGGGNVAVGLVGASPLEGPQAHILLHMGMLKLSTL